MLYLEFDFLDFTVSNNKLIMIKLIRKTLRVAQESLS